MMTQLWRDPDIQIYLDTIPAVWPAESFLLTERELSYCLQSKQEPLQRSRAKLRLMLKEILGDSQAEVQQGLLGRPTVHPEIDISFSHKYNKAIVGLTGSPSRLGIDIESLDQEIDWRVFAKCFFLETDEVSVLRLSAFDGWDLHKARLCIFSLKEAFFKAMGKHFTPTYLEVSYSHMANGRPHFEAGFSNGLLSNGNRCRLFSLFEGKNIISVCHLRGIE